MFFVENMNLIKLVCAIFTLYQNAFCYFFQASEEGKSDNDNNFKDTHRGKASSNTTPALTKIANMGIWDVGTTNQLFIRGS